MITACELAAFSRVSLKTSRLAERIEPGNFRVAMAIRCALGHFRVAMDICCALGHSISMRSLFYSRLVVIVKLDQNDHTERKKETEKRMREERPVY